MTATMTVGEGAAFVFVAVDHCTTEFPEDIGTVVLAHFFRFRAFSSSGPNTTKAMIRMMTSSQIMAMAQGRGAGSFHAAGDVDCLPRDQN